MRIIQSPRNNFKCSKSIDQVRISEFLIIEHYSIFHLIYNLITGEIILLTDEEFTKFINLEFEKSELVKRLFYLPVDYNLIDKLRDMVINRSPIDLSDLSSVIILTTLSCNARCSYCYEKKFEKVNELDNYSDLLIDYINGLKSNNLKITWFGGEPLVNRRLISKVCSNITKDFKSTMISNGSLFTEELVKEAKSLWKLGNVQITLDGTSDNYSKIKNYVDPKINFDLIIKNIKLLLDNEIGVSIRLNASIDNIDDLKSLTEYLIANLNKKNLRIYIQPLFDSNQLDEEIKSKLYKGVLEVKDLLLDNDLYSEIINGFKEFNCMADHRHGVVIAPDGSINMCEHYTYEHSIANLTNPSIINQEELAKFMELNHSDRCYSCPLFPSCRRLKLCADNYVCDDIDYQFKLDTIKLALKYKLRNYLMYLLKDYNEENIISRVIDPNDVSNCM